MPVSPYLLLRASRPRQPQSTVSAYDLYSQAQQFAQDAPDAPAALAQDAPAHEIPIPPSIAQKRTHYISDIHSRHTAAARQARFSPLP